MLSHVSDVQLFVTPWVVAHHAYLSMGFSRQENWSGLPCLPQGLNLGLLHYRHILYHVSHQGSLYVCKCLLILYS